MKAVGAEAPAVVRGAAVAIVSGSGLGVVPDGVEIHDEIPYERLGWPVTGVSGHPSRLLVGRWGRETETTQDARPAVLLACGRAHRYEGWTSLELRRAVDDLASWGVRRLVLTNAAGGLDGGLELGSAVVVDEVIDLQEAPCRGHEVSRFSATSSRIADAATAALGRHLPARRGRYVAVAGPQYETPAEAAWLSARAHVVGMSTVPEVRAAVDHGVDLLAVSVVVNRSGVSVGHAEVLAAVARLEAGLAPGLAAVLLACWPTMFDGCASGPG